MNSTRRLIVEIGGRRSETLEKMASFVRSADARWNEMRRRSFSREEGGLGLVN